MAEAIIYLNGDRVPESKAGLKVFDAGIVLGATTTEMTRTFGHKLFRIEDHVDRLFRSLNYMGLDIGPQSIENFNEALDVSSTIIWNGPMGVFEKSSFSNGTKLIADNLVRLVEANVNVIAGGGDTASALKYFNLIEKLTHVSTGGGASLVMLHPLVVMIGHLVGNVFLHLP